MQQELIEHYPDDSLAVFIVWAPMLESDNEEAARKASSFSAQRVKHFYDPGRRVGDRFRKQVFPDAYDQALASLPADHWMREWMPQMKDRYAGGPEWDIYMFFAPDLKWLDAPPRPTRFVRHLGRVVERGDERLSLMWIDAYSNPPVEGHLHAEIGRLGRELLHSHPATPAR